VLVAVDGRDDPIGYARMELVGGEPHLEQLSVDPRHGRRGVGTALLDAAQAWAGGRPVTLTTFADVPFNRPYYERRGFAVVPEEEWTPALRALVAEEATHGLDPATRVVMRRLA
jgi:GNAT superfamily N-acetyltransferase